MIVSILMVYNYDPTVFDGLRVPSASDLLDPSICIDDPPVISKDTLIKRICMKCAELELLYSDPVTLRDMIQIWCDVKFRTWAVLYNTLCYKYNPIWNKDGSYTDTRTKTGNASGSGNSTTQNDVTGYDSTSFSPNTKDTTNYSSTGQSSENETLTHKEGGNIGTTSTQDLIGQERDAALFNLYDFIAEDFKAEFCLALY